MEACVELSEVGCINFQGRGATTRIAPVTPTETFKPECISCGECMAICPANVLTEAMGKPKGKPWETHKVKTVCSYCGCGCELNLDVVRNQVVGVTPARPGANNGALCAKGRFGYDFINHKDRLKTPMIKRDGYWEEVNWDEALDYAATRLAEIKRQARRRRHRRPHLGAAAPTRTIISFRRCFGGCWGRTTSITAPGCDTPSPWPVWPQRLAVAQ